MLPTESAISSKASEPPSPFAQQSWGGSRFGIVFYVLLCVEIGAFLLVVPWSPAWERTLWLRYLPAGRFFYLSPYLRGAISGLGLINLWLGVSLAWNFRGLASRSDGRG